MNLIMFVFKNMTFNEYFHEYLPPEACLSIFNELLLWLFSKACFLIYYTSYVKFVLFDYCGDYSLQIDNKLGFK